MSKDPPPSTKCGAIPYSTFQSARSILTNGAHIPWLSDERPPFLPNCPNYVRKEHYRGIRTYIDQAIADGILEKATIDSVKCLHPVGSVCREGDVNNDRPRLIMNLVKFNQYVKRFYMYLPSKDDLLQFVNRYNWGIKLDISNGFHNVKLAHDALGYFSFEFEGQYYCYLRLPFGPSFAPACFQEVTSYILSLTCLGNAYGLVLLDDFLIGSLTREGAILARSNLINSLTSYSFVINEAKSMANASRQLVYDGYLIDLQKGALYHTHERRCRIINMVVCLEAIGSCTVTDFASLIGTLSFCITQRHDRVPLGYLYRKLSSCRQSSCIVMLDDCDFKVMWYIIGQSMFPVEADRGNVTDIGAPRLPTILVGTDASGFAFGSYITTSLDSVTLGGSFPCGLIGKQNSGFKELLAILIVIVWGVYHLGWSTVHIVVHTDAKCVVDCWTNRMLAKSECLNWCLWCLIRVAKTHNLFIEMSHIAGSSNTLCDVISRGKLPLKLLNYYLSFNNWLSLFRDIPQPLPEIFTDPSIVLLLELVYGRPKTVVGRVDCC